MLLQDVLYKVAIRSVAGNTSVEVNDIQIDSRKIKPGAVFIAVKGVAADGHQFIEKAIENGAVVIVYEESGLPTPDSRLTYVQVENSGSAAAYMANNFFGRPSEKIKLVGVTGTNGKTTIATLLFKLFTRLGYKCGLLSTVENQIGLTVVPATHTTPDAISLNQLLSQMVNEGCTHVFMETSSHAIHQHRVTGLQYAGGVFSNITHDHLDYHQTFDEYIRVKKAFFDSLSSSAFAISNADDKRGTVMLQNTSAKKFYYSLKTVAEFKGKILDNSLSGLMMIVNDVEVHFRLIGEFNAYNLLAVFGTAVCLGEEKQEVLTAMSILTGAEGRFDYMVSAKDKVIAIVDYAHTPDALLNVLAAAACEHSDKVILTSDNPRSEDPAQIIKDMEEGLSAAAKRKYISIVDRKEAIKTAISLAKPEDIILVAGKGHEKYQEIKGVRSHFDDKEIVKEFFELLDK